MTATYTWDVFCSLDGFGTARANWTGYWGKQGPELLDHRLALYEVEQRMVFGATTFRDFDSDAGREPPTDSEVRDPWVTRMSAAAGDGGVDDLGGPARVAGRDRRER